MHASSALPEFPVSGPGAADGCSPSNSANSCRARAHDSYEAWMGLLLAVVNIAAPHPAAEYTL
eukprot:scaffold517551_cov40-Prasinocladus_malaysianus.AAC.1